MRVNVSTIFTVTKRSPRERALARISHVHSASILRCRFVCCHLPAPLSIFPFLCTYTRKLSQSIRSPRAHHGHKPLERRQWHAVECELERRQRPKLSGRQRLLSLVVLTPAPTPAPAVAPAAGASNVQLLIQPRFQRHEFHRRQRLPRPSPLPPLPFLLCTPKRVSPFLFPCLAFGSFCDPRALCCCCCCCCCCCG